MKKYLIIGIPICLLVVFVFIKQGGNYNRFMSKSNTVAYRLNGSENTDRLQKFIDNVEKGSKDRINLIRYTTEGDPLITQLYFNDKDIIVSVDNSKDMFGGPDKRRIQTSTIKGQEGLKDSLLSYLKVNYFKY